MTPITKNGRLFLNKDSGNADAAFWVLRYSAEVWRKTPAWNARLKIRVGNITVELHSSNEEDDVDFTLFLLKMDRLSESILRFKELLVEITEKELAGTKFDPVKNPAFTKRFWLNGTNHSEHYFNGYVAISIDATRDHRFTVADCQRAITLNFYPKVSETWGTDYSKMHNKEAHEKLDTLLEAIQFIKRDAKVLIEQVVNLPVKKTKKSKKDKPVVTDF